jgi:hypothetical protein
VDPREILLDDRDAGGLAGADRPVQVVDRRFLDTELLVGHGPPPSRAYGLATRSDILEPVR